MRERTGDQIDEVARGRDGMGDGCRVLADAVFDEDAGRVGVRESLRKEIFTQPGTAIHRGGEKEGVEEHPVLVFMKDGFKRGG